MKRALFSLLLVSAAVAHISLLHPSVYDKELYDDDHKDSNGNSDPLENYTFDQWWWHRNLNYPPKDRPDNVFELPANGKAKAWIANSRTFTPYGWPERMFPNPEGITEPFSSSPYVQWNNIHTSNRSDVAGCSLGIAYKSNRYDVKPEDFVIFSVAHDCPARWLQTFEIPNLPACPNNMCQCAWFWVHKSYGGTDQMYMTPFQCRVTGARSDAKPIDISRARPPRKCYNPATCTMGPRNPMYWMNKERNNMHEPNLYAPSYSTLYGFPEGAQKDIFVDTNTVNYTPMPFPPTKSCGGYLSRLVSNGNSTINQQQYLKSPNCRHHAWITGDGKFCVGDSNWNIYWDSTVYNQPNPNGDGFSVRVNSDGTVTLFNNQNQIKWTSPMTKGVGQGPYRLELTDDGQLVFFDSFGNNLWENFWYDNREQSWVTPFNPDPPIWKTFKPNTNQTASTTSKKPPATTSSSGRTAGSVLVGKDVYGGDYNQTNANSFSDCQSKCVSNTRCKAWAFDTCGSSCWLKETVADPIDGGNCRTSGIIGDNGLLVTTTTNPTRTPAPTPSTNGKFVFAHYMVGYAYNSDQGFFQNTIQQAKNAGIDGFAANIGKDSWQVQKVQYMLDAANSVGGFKIFISFDMNEIDNDVGTLDLFVNKFVDHPAYFRYNGRPFVSTFAGQDKNLGIGNGGNDAWTKWKTQHVGTKNIYFCPVFFGDLAGNFNQYPVIDCLFSWDAWGATSSNSRDVSAIQAAHSKNKQYMTGVAPWFYCHLPQWGKNWVFPDGTTTGADNLYPLRWKQAIDSGSDFVEIITWNDYSESSYIAPLSSEVPDFAKPYADNMDHSGWLAMTAYYAKWFKTGVSQPSSNTVYWSYRIHPRDESRNDNYPRPTLNWTPNDCVAVHAISKDTGAVITINIGGRTTSYTVNNRLESWCAPFNGVGDVRVSVQFQGQNKNAPGGPTIQASGNTYNFNEWAGSLQY